MRLVTELVVFMSYVLEFGGYFELLIRLEYLLVP